MNTNNENLCDGVPSLNYEAAKDFFYAKLERDRHGHGRMESAMFHTAQWIFGKGCQGRDQLCARIAALEARVVELELMLSASADTEIEREESLHG